jgi:hypothetical protein
LNAKYRRSSCSSTTAPSKPHPNPRRRPLVAAQPPTRAHTRSLPGQQQWQTPPTATRPHASALKLSVQRGPSETLVNQLYGEIRLPVLNPGGLASALEVQPPPQPPQMEQTPTTETPEEEEEVHRRRASRPHCAALSLALPHCILHTPLRMVARWSLTQMSSIISCKHVRLPTCPLLYIDVCLFDVTFEVQ